MAIGNLMGGNLGLADGLGLAKQQQQAAQNMLNWGYYNTAGAIVMQPVRYQAPIGIKIRTIERLRTEIKEWHGDVLGRN